MRIELSHDILAKKVFQKASKEDKQILQIERLISDSYQRYISRELFMERADIEYIEPFLGKINKTEVEREFITDSKAYIIEQDRKRKRRIFITNAIMFGLIAVAVGAMIWASSRISAANEIYAEKEKEVTGLQETLNIARVSLASAEEKAHKIIENAEHVVDSAKYQVALANQSAIRIRQKAQWEVVQAQKKSDAKIKAAEEIADKKIASATKEAQDKIADANKAADTKIKEANTKANKIKKEADQYQAEKERFKNVSETSQLSSQALRSLNAGNEKKAAKLALDAREKWIKATKEKNNELQNAENYTALNEILKTMEGQNERVYDLHGTSIRSVATNNKGWLVSADEDGFIHFSKQNNENLAAFKKGFKSFKISKNFKEEDQIHTVAIANNNIIAGTLRGNLLIFNADTLTNTLNRAGKHSTYLNLKDAEKDPRIKVLRRFDHPIEYLEASPNGKYIAFNTLMQQHLYILNANTGETITKVAIKGISTLTWENDKTLWVGKETGVSLLKFDGKRLVNQTPSKMPSSNIKAIAVQKKHIIFGGNKGKVWILDRIKNVFLNDLNGAVFFKAHRSGITSIKFNPDGTKFVSSSMDGTAKIWNLKHLNDPENEKIVLSGHQKWIYGAAFSSNGQFIYTVSEDATLRQWYVDEDRLAKHLESLLKK